MFMPYKGPDLSYAQGAWSPQGWENFGIVNGSRANIGFAVGSYYHWQVDRLRQALLEVGHYFFIGNYDAIQCADFFVDNLYDFREGDTLWLDMEPEGGTGTVVWSPAKCLAFCLRVFQRTGVMPGIYLNKSLENGYDWSALVAAGVRLWSAYYQDGALPYVRNWAEVSMIQWTSTPIDTNAAAYTQAQMAGAPPAPEKDDDMPLFDSNQRRVFWPNGFYNSYEPVVYNALHYYFVEQPGNEQPGTEGTIEREVWAANDFMIARAAKADAEASAAATLAALKQAGIPVGGSGDTAADAAAIADAVLAGLSGVKIQIDSADLADTILDAASQRHFFTNSGRTSS